MAEKQKSIASFKAQYVSIFLFYPTQFLKSLKFNKDRGSTISC